MGCSWSSPSPTPPTATATLQPQASDTCWVPVMHYRYPVEEKEEAEHQEDEEEEEDNLTCRKYPPPFLTRTTILGHGLLGCHALQRSPTGLKLMGWFSLRQNFRHGRRLPKNTI